MIFKINYTFFLISRVLINKFSIDLIIYTLLIFNFWQYILFYDWFYFFSLFLLILFNFLWMIISIIFDIFWERMNLICNLRCRRRTVDILVKNFIIFRENILLVRWINLYFLLSTKILRLLLICLNFLIFKILGYSHIFNNIILRFFSKALFLNFIRSL